VELRKKKDKNLTDADQASGEIGSIWDHTAVDARSKLMVSLVQSPSRDQASSDRLVEDFADRTDHVTPSLATSDEHPTYPNSIRKTYGKPYRPRGKKGSRRKQPMKFADPKGMVYGTVNKTREHSEVVDISIKVVFGTEADLAKVLNESPCSRTINTSFVERNNATARHFNARKQRKTYCFSKRYLEHVAMSWLMLTHYNFCWAPRTLATPGRAGTKRDRSPAMAAGLTSHVWSVEELLMTRVGGRA
jgi:hypothetical protein